MFELISGIQAKDPTNEHIAGYRQVSVYAALFGQLDVLSVNSAKASQTTQVSKWSALRKLIEAQASRSAKNRPRLSSRLGKSDPASQAKVAESELAQAPKVDAEAFAKAEAIAEKFMEFVQVNLFQTCLKFFNYMVLKNFKIVFKHSFLKSCLIALVQVNPPMSPIATHLITARAFGDTMMKLMPIMQSNESQAAAEQKVQLFQIY